MAMSRTVPVVETKRLLLRGWTDADREPYAALNADPEVRRHFPSTLTTAQSDAEIDRMIDLWETRGFCFWAVEVAGQSGCIGMLGLSSPLWTAPFTPCIEIGWRLARSAWGQGLAPEGARAALRWGFDTLHTEEIVSFTTVSNLPSQRVMEKIGMVRDVAGDFEHPAVRADSPMLRHVLYRIPRERLMESLMESADNP
jgi:RimJ/RimL family protein N-acetyltransferase